MILSNKVNSSRHCAVRAYYGEINHCNTTASVLPNLTNMCSVLFDVISLVLYLADIASDIMLLVGYSNSGDWFWFILSFLFVLLPSLVVNCFSFSAYLDTGLSNLEMIVRFIFAIL